MLRTGTVRAPVSSKIWPLPPSSISLRRMSRRILEYFTAIDSDTKALDKQVNNFVKDGFQPYGDPYVIPGEKSQVCQAIVLLEEDSAGMTLSAQNPFDA